LDSSYRYFDIRTGHLLPIRVRLDTFRKRVIDVIRRLHLLRIAGRPRFGPRVWTPGSKGQ
jgi:hypothetical protein